MASLKSYHIKGVHCSYCGIKFAEQINWPRKCFCCGNISYCNPLPVTVSMVKVWNIIPDPEPEYDSEREAVGLLLIRRNIEPEKGKLAFPGGYINFGESWQEAAVRELKEEVGIELDAKDAQLYGVEMATNGNLLIFNTFPSMFIWSEIKFEPNEEVSEIVFAENANMELAFPTHTRNFAKYLPTVNKFSME